MLRLIKLRLTNPKKVKVMPKVRNHPPRKKRKRRTKRKRRRTKILPSTQVSKWVYKQQPLCLQERQSCLLSSKAPRSCQLCQYLQAHQQQVQHSQTPDQSRLKQLILAPLPQTPLKRWKSARKHLSPKMSKLQNSQSRETVLQEMEAVKVLTEATPTVSIHLRILAATAILTLPQLTLRRRSANSRNSRSKSKSQRLIQLTSWWVLRTSAKRAQITWLFSFCPTKNAKSNWTKVSYLVANMMLRISSPIRSENFAFFSIKSPKRTTIKSLNSCWTTLITIHRFCRS